jgi:hypothetical protein
VKYDIKIQNNKFIIDFYYMVEKNRKSIFELSFERNSDKTKLAEMTQQLIDETETFNENLNEFLNKLNEIIEDESNDL